MRNIADPSRNLPVIESLDKGLQVLQMFQERSEVRVSDAAAELGVARSTAHRILATLAGRGFVTQDPGSKVYRTGRALMEMGLGSIGQFDIRRKAHRHMARLADELRETVNLVVLEGNACRIIDGVESDQMVRVSLRTGALVAAHASAGGKVLLAELDRAELGGLFDGSLRPLTHMTRTDIDELYADLVQVRRLGYALNYEESQVGLRAVAVPVRDHAGRVIAALAILVPAARFHDSRVADFASALLQASRDITHDLG
ncbi:IclR family transcriptional regulator [Microbacterium sp. NPDC096154]|uniref:IclR family transcriptional regulator n=1 Tax=Microbacterium sp. NPDC096154 TaxID=3155549 RepID=UPI00332D0B75